jgi:hypothetical protein
MIQIPRFRCSGRASLESRRPLAAWDILPMKPPLSADNRASENLTIILKVPHLRMKEIVNRKGCCESCSVQILGGEVFT